MSVENLTDPISGEAVTVPDLTFHVNPSEESKSFKKIIHRYRTRSGWIEEHWGEELDHIAITGSTGTFYHPNYGTNTSFRYETLAMINFQEILSLFRNNAVVYGDSGQTLAQGDVVITFDGFKFYGQFANFSWVEDAKNPFRFTFNFNFEVNKTLVGV